MPFSMRTTDNNCGVETKNYEQSDIDNIKHIANKTLSDLQKDNPDLLVFPSSFRKNRDDIEKGYIFSLNDKKLTTYNLMGFIGRNSTQFTISSRFAKSDDSDYFLHYMLQKVFAINLLKFDQTPNKENIWDFLLYLFPHYLKKAYSQGIYKAYKRQEDNDGNVKGSIDVKRHLLKNIPFTGKIAYTTREYSYDNSLTQLIRHTIEHIRTHPYGSGVLTNDSELRDIISKFVFVTNKTYNSNSRHKVITANLKPATHPYFTEYFALQKICLRILRHEKITFGKEKDKVYGLLFDGAWLWEEYLYTILKKCGFKHPKNKESKGAIYLFKKNKSNRRYPDFWKDNFILEAKYKKMTDKNPGRDDMNQLISYMYIKQAKIGGFMVPSPHQGKIPEFGELNGYGGKVYIGSLLIPQESENFEDFKSEMLENENTIISEINEITKNHA